MKNSETLKTRRLIYGDICSLRLSRHDTAFTAAPLCLQVSKVRVICVRFTEKDRNGARSILVHYIRRRCRRRRRRSLVV